MQVSAGRHDSSRMVYGISGTVQVDGRDNCNQMREGDIANGEAG